MPKSPDCPHYHVFIPAVFSPLAPWQRDFSFVPESAALMALLAKAQHQTLPVVGLERSVLHWLGMEVRTQLPWAALRHQAESGGMHASPLLCADPVFMRSGIDSVTLDAHAPSLSREDTEALLVALNQHLAQDGLVLKAFSPQQWYLHAVDDSFARDLPLTTPPSEVGAENVFPYLPQAGDQYWTQLFNEIQMLLHTQPVNQQREAAGLAPVNGLWLWGEGAVKTVGLRSIAAVYGGGMCGEVVAKLVQARWSEQFSIEAVAGRGEVLVILDQLCIPARGDQPERWQLALSGLERSLAGLLEKQRAGASEVSLYDAAGNAWHCQKPGRWWWGGRQSAGWEEFVC